MLKKRFYKELLRGNIGIEVKNEKEQAALMSHLKNGGINYKQGFNMVFQPDTHNIYFLDKGEIHMTRYLTKEDRIGLQVYKFKDCLKKINSRFVDLDTVFKSIENKDNTMFIQFVTLAESRYEKNTYLYGYSNVVQIVIGDTKEDTWKDYEHMVSTFNNIHKTISTDGTGRAVRLNKSPAITFTKEQHDLINFFTDTLDQFKVV